MDEWCYHLLVLRLSVNDFLEKIQTSPSNAIFRKIYPPSIIDERWPVNKKTPIAVTAIKARGEYYSLNNTGHSGEMNGRRAGEQTTKIGDHYAGILDSVMRRSQLGRGVEPTKDHR
jgi:hypothetical protein